MIEQDTIKLLRECDAGVKMGVTSIEEVLGKAKAPAMRKALADCKAEHEALGEELRAELARFRDEGKDPNPMAEGMSWVKTEAMLLMKDCADLMTDGCGMGVKSLNRYLNQYEAASERAKDIAKRLIHLEQTLAEDMREFL